MTAPDTPPADPELTLSQALKRAFDEAGNPSLRTVAAAGTKVSRQRLSDWRAGRHTPATFSDLEPVLAYLYLAAEIGQAESTNTATDRVTQWPLSQWQQIWQNEASATAHRASPSATQAPARGETDQPEAVDRRPLAIAIVTLLVVLVAALAVAVYGISSLTM